MMLRVMSATVLLCLAIADTAVAQINLISNGSFETNGGVNSTIFTSWTETQLAGSSGQNYFVQTGTTAPPGSSGQLFPVPPLGTFAAGYHQSGPGAAVISQDIVVPFGVTSATLSWQRFYNNTTASWILGPADFVFTGAPTQFSRVDFLTTGAGVFSTGAGVLQNVYTSVGEPLNTVTYGLQTFDVTALLQAQAGNTIRLRFGSADNQGSFLVGLDDVQLIVAVPEPTTWALVGFGIIGSASYFYRRRRTNQLALESKLR